MRLSVALRDDIQLNSRLRDNAELERRLTDAELRLEQERQQWLVQRTQLMTIKPLSQHNIEVLTLQHVKVYIVNN